MRVAVAVVHGTVLAALAVAVAQVLEEMLHQKQPGGQEHQILVLVAVERQTKVVLRPLAQAAPV